MKASILGAARLLLIASIFTGCFPPFAGHDDGYYEGDACDWEPDLIVEEFTFTTNEQSGTVIDFQDITLCNIGDAAAGSGYRYQVLLSQTPDWSDSAWCIFESAPMVGVEAWDCVSVELTVAVGDVPPEGYFYVIVDVDYTSAIDECDESNNWTRSDDAVFVVPEGSGSL